MGQRPALGAFGLGALLCAAPCPEGCKTLSFLCFPQVLGYYKFQEPHCISSTITIRAVAVENFPCNTVGPNIKNYKYADMNCTCSGDPDPREGMGTPPGDPEFEGSIPRRICADYTPPNPDPPNS